MRVGMEATGYARWFERLLTELRIELWIGDAAKIKTKRVRKQKTDRNDAQLLFELLLDNSLPKIWVPSPENRDLRQLLWHRHRLVQMLRICRRTIELESNHPAQAFAKPNFLSFQRAPAATKPPGPVNSLQTS